MTGRWQPKPPAPEAPVESRPDAAITSQHMLRRMDQIDRELSDIQHTGNSRWIVPYADLITLLLGLFMVLFVLARTDSEKLAGQTEQLTRENRAVTSQLVEQQAQNAAIVTFLEEKLKESPELADKIAELGVDPNESGLDTLADMLNEKLAIENGIRVTQEDLGVLISLS